MWLLLIEISLTPSFAQVGVEALRLEHNEQGAPAQQHSREKQVLDDRRHRHPPAAGEGCGERGSHLSWVRGCTSRAWLEDVGGFWSLEGEGNDQIKGLLCIQMTVVSYFGTHSEL